MTRKTDFERTRLLGLLVSATEDSLVSLDCSDPNVVVVLLNDLKGTL